MEHIFWQKRTVSSEKHIDIFYINILIILHIHIFYFNFKSEGRIVNKYSMYSSKSHTFKIFNLLKLCCVEPLKSFMYRQLG